ncbi:MAG: spore coat protein [Firmicutes bacterium]|nr:spore coat protein [Bacillota bacterium]
MQSSNSLSEQDVMNDLLTMEKQIASAYNTGVTEASCQDLRQTLTDSLVGTQQMQYSVYDTMRKQGWYQTKDAQEQDVTNAKNKYNSMKNQL